MAVTARTGWTPSSHATVVVAFVAVTATLGGAALSLRGPDLVGLQVLMAEQAVTLPDGRDLYVQKYEVSVAEWNACHEAGACALRLQTRPGSTPEITPATGLNHGDALQFVAWVSAVTGHPFRLPTAEEWNFMARDVLPDEPDPIFTDPSLSWASTYVTEGAAPRALQAQGSFSTSAEGVVDLDGSVWEWTQDCYAGVDDEVEPDRCPAYFVGGEHVAAMSFLERDPARGGCAVGAPPAHLGLRLVTDVRTGT